MKLRSYALIAALCLSLVALPIYTGCQAIASYLLYEWIQDEFNNGDDNSNDDESPMIEKISSDHQYVQRGDTVLLEVSASDKQDSEGELDYFWFASAGDLTSPTSKITQWKAPATSGKVTISILVEDTDGNQDSQSVEIQVQ